MKTDISYLPVQKQQELTYLVQLIQDTAPAEMIILFGSYARNDWVEDKYDEEHFRYQSDMDILVVVETKSETTQSKYQLDIKHTIRQDETLKTPVSIIVHDIEFFNRRLRKGQYFFSDIKKEGIFLYNSGNYQLDEAKELLPLERRNLAFEDFEYYFKEADEFKEIVDFCLSKNRLNKAAFLLHQTAERLYAVILLVFTRYKPNTHNLEILRKLAYSVSNELAPVFPLSTDENRWLFDLLVKAYVDARYKPSYKITKNELEQLIKHVEYLRNVAHSICEKKIESFV
ncbi:MAG: HEPN domain-containing protein [Pseudomonadota bacterium]